jgi:hypothetical protein
MYSGTAPDVPCERTSLETEGQAIAVTSPARRNARLLLFLFAVNLIMMVIV